MIFNPGYCCFLCMKAICVSSKLKLSDFSSLKFSTYSLVFSSKLPLLCHFLWFSSKKFNKNNILPLLVFSFIVCYFDSITEKRFHCLNCTPIRANCYCFLLNVANCTMIYTIAGTNLSRDKFDAEPILTTGGFAWN